MKYRFEKIENGQLRTGALVPGSPVVIIEIANHEAEVANDDTEAILLAEKNGGELVTQQGKPPKDPTAYKAQAIKKGDSSQ